MVLHTLRVVEVGSTMREEEDVVQSSQGFLVLEVEAGPATVVVVLELVLEGLSPPGPLG